MNELMQTWLCIAFVYVGCCGIGKLLFFSLRRFEILDLRSIVGLSWLRTAVYLCIGQAAFTLTLWGLGYLGFFRVAVWGGLIVGALYLVFDFYTRWRLRRNRVLISKDTVTKTLFNKFTLSSLGVAVLVMCLASYYSDIALSHPIEGVPGMGNWAYKVKVIFVTQGVTEKYFQEFATHYGKFSYPAGFPLLGSVFYTLSNSVNEYALQLNNVVLLLLCYTLIIGCFLQRWNYMSLVAIVALTLLFLSEPVSQMLYSFYSEPLLLFCCVVSLSILSISNDNSGPKKRLKCELCDRVFAISILCASSAAWVKQEGIAFFCLLCVFSVSFLTFKNLRLKSLIYVVLSSTALFIVPWKLLTSVYSIKDSDFVFSSMKNSFTHPNVGGAMNKVYMLMDWNKHYVVLWFLPVLLLVSCLLRDARLLLVSFIGLSLVIIYGHSMAWSAVKLEWHLTSIERYLFLPAICAFFGLLQISPFVLQKLKTHD